MTQSPTILDQIVASKIKEVAYRKQHFALKMLQRSKMMQRACISMSQAIKECHQPGIIAEFKRRSPSKPDIFEDAEIQHVVPDYIQNGATALSVLTDSIYFGGSLEDLIQARRLSTIPILRKDFVIEPYQITEAKVAGADAILLIAELHTASVLKELRNIAHDHDLEVLVELHGEEQLEKLDDGFDMVGVNNRNLSTFETHINHSLDMIKALPTQAVKISESGIHHVSDAIQLAQAGYEAFLIGEQFMVTGKPGTQLRLFKTQIHTPS